MNDIPENLYRNVSRFNCNGEGVGVNVIQALTVLSECLING